MTARHERAVSAVAAAGLVVMAVLSLSGGAVQPEPAASSGRAAIQILLPSPAAQPETAVPGQAPVDGPGVPAGSGAGRVALIVVAAGAVSAFTALQVSARSRGRRAQACADRRRWPPARDPGRSGKGTSRCPPGGN